eukprot:CAMPEP_0117671338 /NCGR_PEP_ID=MMETSP0804-20121206/13278_1 /TAXON_ID=1074897 /ORGANISM="Tetraselmis astigmatica, Strain CCMP880" /LENGTH=206 /DNA_ID=CAMNT_0005479787 /DNA_START=57 /DNA_END=677 /DNA_ORIENTATION=+
MEVISFQLVSAVQRGDLQSVADALQRGSNPNGRYAGTYPLHTAVEEGNVDMAAFLLHWGAEPKDKLDAAGKSALVLAQELAKANTGEPKHGEVVKVLSDEKERCRVVEDLKERMEAEHQRIMQARKAALPKQILFTFFLVMLTIAALHGFIVYFPDAAEKYIPPKMLSDIQLLSPLLEHPAHKAYKEALETQAYPRVEEPDIKTEL